MSWFQPAHKQPGMDASAVLPDGPLKLISACHAHTLQQCADLRRLVRHLESFGCDAQARQLGRQVLEYFDAAAFQMHAEEEGFLFPALLESSAGLDAATLREMISGMTRQHRVLEQLWQSLRDRLLMIANAGSGVLCSAEVEAFVRPLEQNIDGEDNKLLPMVSRLFTDCELASVRKAGFAVGAVHRH